MIWVLLLGLLAALAALLVLVRSTGSTGDAVRLTDTAHQHLARGDLVATEALLSAIPQKAAARGAVRRAVSSVRALVALYEGRHEESIRFATSAIEAERALASRDHEAAQVAAALAIRALAHAALGKDLAAKGDADAAERSAHATPEVIARARIVRALVASRAAYHEEAFRAYLDTNASLVLEHAMPRERALFRALRRMARSPHRGVYRQPGKVASDRAPSKLASWVAYVAPEAAAHVDDEQRLADHVEEPPVDSGVPSDVRALRTARASTSSAARGGRVAALLAALTPGRRRALAVARRQVALGELDRAVPALARLALGGGMEAAAAGLELARIATSQTLFAEAISRCDAAIALVQQPRLRAEAVHDLLPSLMAESAVAAASRGGLEDADAELAVLCRDFPTFAHRATAQLRVKLLRSVRAGHRNAARNAARARTAEMALPHRENVLADLILASRDEVSDEERARLDAELNGDAALRKWVDAVAPGLRDEHGVQGSRARIAARPTASAPEGGEPPPPDATIKRLEGSG